MQDYIAFAKKNEVVLMDRGNCQFCGANTRKGIHECLEIFNLGFQEIDFTNIENNVYRFKMVDAHALQHPEIHGRWSNHFHLSRLQLILKYDIQWTYRHSPKLSDYLNKYKIDHLNEFLIPPDLLNRGSITTTDVLEKSKNGEDCKQIINDWAREVYSSWSYYHSLADLIAKGFLNQK
ncbi:DUF5946 family protein [Flagellimonas algicola]|uniref:Uncharacterized protein n=1 Tax=Flagellimonas algicola TaxID=2583815 RepID=A0ABY2WHK9_9FLAO|nr:DUF5946 family protein [Allomuricauda algicola]TMU50732.1 hypothetical protein FGG15_18200 [Allomuricauda algicola]